MKAIATFIIGRVLYNNWRFATWANAFIFLGIIALATGITYVTTRDR